MSRRPARIGVAPILALLLALGTARSDAVLVKDNLYGVKTLDGDAAWAVGNFGSIYHTTDGGRTWDASDSGTRTPLFGVDFSDAQHGWVVGKAAVILRTTDGGRTWTSQKNPIPPDKHLFSVKAIDANTAWAVGDWGAMTVTHDGGATWEDRSLGTFTVKVEQSPDRTVNTISDDVILYDLAFADAQHGMVVGEFGTVLATTDGGATWGKQDAGTDKTLFGVALADALRGWAVGLDGLLLHTRDGGGTWTVQHGVAHTEALEDLGFLDAFKNPGFYAVAVAGQYGVVVGDSGTLLTSADAGETWAERPLPEKDRFRWVRAVSLVTNHGIAVGAGGFTVPIARDQIVLAVGTKDTKTP